MVNIQNSRKTTGIISSPGRICLFGEHQDYLGLPVIPMAINRRLKLIFTIDPEKSNLKISSGSLSLTEIIEHKDIQKLSGSPFDYIKAVFNYYQNSISKKSLPSNVKIQSTIPIKSGLSSSAALIVSTVFLVANIILQKELTVEAIADTAYIVEHDILRVSCGRMDQTSSAFGGVFHLTTSENVRFTPLNLPENSFFVIGDSEIPRQADIPLKHIQGKIFKALEEFDVRNLAEFSDTTHTYKRVSQQDQKLIEGVIGVRDNTQKALKEFKSPNTDLNTLGLLLNEQHQFLSDCYRVSHPKIDRMCKIARAAGALGAKITGAGFGGCMFALADSFASALKIHEKLIPYGKSYITQQSYGVRNEISV